MIEALAFVALQIKKHHSAQNSALTTEPRHPPWFPGAKQTEEELKTEQVLPIPGRRRIKEIELTFNLSVIASSNQVADALNY